MDQEQLLMKCLKKESVKIFECHKMNKPQRIKSAIEKLLLEVSLCFLGVTIGLEVHSCRDTNRCEESLANTPSISQYFCQNSSLRDDYLILMDEGNNPLLAYEQVLKRYYKTINCPTPVK